jgi:hypothetical protein
VETITAEKLLASAARLVAVLAIPGELRDVNEEKAERSVH